MTVKEDIYKVEATVELEVPMSMVDDLEKLGEELTGEFIKVKGGLYENAAFGSITGVSKISPDVREWEVVK